jgi:hypothetical protein
MIESLSIQLEAEYTLLLVPTEIPFLYHEYTGEVPPFKATAVNVAEVDEHIEPEADEFIEMSGVTNALIVMLLLLIVPVFTGALLITRILYPAPVGVFEGIVAIMVPAAVDVSVPMFTGLVNEPVALLNCAVKTLPAVNVPDLEYVRLNVVPAHLGDITAPVVIVCENPLLKTINKKHTNANKDFISENLN